MDFENRHHEYATLNFACDALISAAKARYGTDGARFDHRYLRYFLEDSLDLSALKQHLHWKERGTYQPKSSFNSIPGSGEASFPAALANAGIAWAIMNRFPGYERTRFTSSFYDDAVSDGLRLYEDAFGKIPSRRYDWLRTFQSLRNPGEPKYPIFNHMTTGNYPAACEAWKAFQLLNSIRDDAKLPADMGRLKAPEAILALTGGAIDISDGWEEDLVSYTLATELLGALRVFYDDAVEKDKKLFKEATSIDDVREIARELDMDLKTECFLDGVPASDIVA